MAYKSIFDKTETSPTKQSGYQPLFAGKEEEKAKEVEKKPILNVAKPQKFAPLSVSKTKKDTTQLKVKKTKSSFNIKVKEIEKKDSVIPSIFTREAKEKMQIAQNLRKAVQPKKVKQIGDFLSNFLARIDPHKTPQDTTPQVAKNIFILKNIDTPQAKKELARLEEEFGKSAVDVIAGGLQKVTGKATEKIAEKVIPKLSKELQPLAKEATKFKSVKDFIQNLDKNKLEVFKKQKINIEDFFKQANGLRERGFVTSVKSAFPEIKKVEGLYTPRSTDELAQKARTLIEDDINVAEKLVAEGTDEKAVATASELLKHYSAQAELATSKGVQNAIYDKAADVANKMAVKLTELGRSVQAASILARLTPEGQVRFAAKQIQKYNEAAKLTKKIPELTGEQSKKIINEMKEIQSMKDGTEKAIKFKKLQDEIADLIPSPLIQKVISVWKAGLLTGLKTSGLNIFANISHLATEAIKDIPATAVDKVSSLFTGKRTISPTLRGTAGGVKEGFGKGLRFLKTGFDERNVAQKLDWKRVSFGNSKVAKGLQKYEETVFRVLGSEDQPFYYGAKARSLADQAKAQAITNGLRGSERAKFVDNLIKNPTDDMLKYSVLDAETAVFQNKTALGNAAKKIQEIGGGLGEIVVPFGRTPSAVATQIIHYTPIGIAQTIFKNIGKGNFDQRLFSQAIGRGLTGTGVLAIGTELFKRNLMTLDFPKSEREQKLWEAEGRKPNSIKVGEKWRSIQALGPAGNVLLIGGHFYNAFKTSGSASEAMIKALAGSVKSFTEQTFLTGVNRTLDAINDPERSAKFWASSMIGSLVPTLISDIAKSKDTKERRSEKMLDYFKSRIPFLRESLEPKVTIFGEEIARRGNPLEVMLDPTRPQKQITTPVISELRRLYDLDYKVSPTLVGDKKGFASLTPQENTALWKRTGQIINSKLQNLFDDEQYKNLDDEQKSKIIESFVKKAKIIGRAEKVMELTQDLSGDELLNKFSELKESRLMTRDVYNKFLELR